VEVLYKLFVLKLKFKKTDLKGNDVKEGKTDYVTVAGHMTKVKSRQVTNVMHAYPVRADKDWQFVIYMK
jgi:hypothetical protein